MLTTEKIQSLKEQWDKVEVINLEDHSIKRIKLNINRWPVEIVQQLAAADIKYLSNFASQRLKRISDKAAIHAAYI